MLARGIHSYHRPNRLDEAMDLAAQGAIPLAGGTRLLATPGRGPERAGPLRPRSRRHRHRRGRPRARAPRPPCRRRSTRLWPTTRRATSCPRPAAPNRPRGRSATMATLGGESVHGAHDSEVVAALLALNAVFVVAHPKEIRESPALRFLRDPAGDLEGGGLVQTIVIPGAPGGAALERARLAPVRARHRRGCGDDRVRRRQVHPRAHRRHRALTRPARVLEAEAQIERTTAEADAVGRAIEQLVAHAPFRSDATATAEYRRKVARRPRRPGARGGHREGPSAREPRGAAQPPPRFSTSGGPGSPLLHVGPDRALRQRPRPAGRRRGADDTPGSPAPRGPDRGQGRLRHRRVRGVLRSPRWPAGERLPGSRHARARPDRADGGGTGRSEGAPPPAEPPFWRRAPCCAATARPPCCFRPRACWTRSPSPARPRSRTPWPASCADATAAPPRCGAVLQAAAATRGRT